MYNFFEVHRYTTSKVLIGIDCGQSKLGKRAKEIDEELKK